MMQNLKIGKDIRKSGLSFIIKEILLHGYDVINEHLPDYLDEKAKIFILLVTYLIN
jgi:hypothetical protein